MFVHASYQHKLTQTQGPALPDEEGSPSTLRNSNYGQYNHD